MSLATRLSLFFLGMLAVVLAGFSGALYFLASSHLHRQLQERLQASLGILAAAAEVDAIGIEWEPHERLLSFPTDGGELPVWVVLDGKGRRVDGSHLGQEDYLIAALGREDSLEQARAKVVAWPDGQWYLAWRRFQATTPRLDKEGKKVPVLVIGAAVSLTPTRLELRWLALVLLGLSAGLWLGVVLAGRRLCRRALRPLTRMARSARSITAADLGQRLPPAHTGDELADLGQAFNDLLGRLQESFERQRRFTGDASHQLRTPLTAMLGQLEVALRRERSPDEYRRVLGAVQGQAVHLRHLVEMLLFLARADAETRLPDLQRLDLGEWLSQHLQSWTAHPRRQDLAFAAPDQPLWVQAQVPLLGQALDNLLDNTCKYSPPGSRITLRTWQQEETICLEVADKGCGISPEDLPQVFDPFFRSPQARRQGIQGLGLGLAVTHRIVVAMGGRIEATSEPGQGSRFLLTLPAARPGNQDETAPGAHFPISDTPDMARQ